MYKNSTLFDNCWFISGVLGIVALLFAYLLYPRTGVGDTDAFIYIIGTYTIKAGNGFRDSLGNAITHWPPGYSLLLSILPLAPLMAATLVNNLSFAIATALIFLLAHHHGWQVKYALCLAIFVAMGFFRSIAFFAKADMVTYALFLGALFAYWSQPSSRIRYLVFTIWNLLIPIKLVTAVITPAALLSEFVTTWQKNRRFPNLIPFIYPTLTWVLSLGGLLLYNQWVSNTLISSSHAPSSLDVFVRQTIGFITSIPRTSLAYWYGSLRDPVALAFFGIALLLGITTLLTLRPGNQTRQRWYFGFFLIGLTYVLLSVRNFDINMRTTGYGVLVLLLLCLPLLNKWSQGLWTSYAIAITACAIANVLLVNAQSANHPMYETLVRDVQGDLPAVPPAVLYSNGYYVTDIHAGIYSTPSTTLPPARAGTYFLWMDLPNVDGISTTILEAPTMTSDWCPIANAAGSILYEACLP